MSKSVVLFAVVLLLSSSAFAASYNLVMSSTGNGTISPPAGTTVYTDPATGGHATATIVATPGNGHEVLTITDNGTVTTYNTAATVTYSIVMSVAHTVAVAFDTDSALLLSSVGSGTVVPSPGLPAPGSLLLFTPGDTAHLAITPNTGRTIVEVIIGSTEYPINSPDPIADYPIVMDTDHTVQVVFDCLVTLAVSGDGETDPGPGAYLVAGGTGFSANAITHTGSLFDHWDQDGNNLGNPDPITIYPVADTTLTAVFLPFHTLTVTTHGHGTSNYPTGSYTFPATQTILLSMTADIGHQLARVTLDGVTTTYNASGNVNITNIHMDTDHTADIVFTDYLITMAVQGTGTTTPPVGTVYPVVGGDPEAFQATETPPYVFSQWQFGGTTIGDLSSLSTSFTSDGTLTAVFITGYHLTMQMQGQGTISPGAGVYGYAPGASVPITITPKPNHAVVQTLLDGVATSIPSSITMDQDHTVFVQFTDWLLTLGVDGDGETNPATGIYPFTDGEQVSIDAIEHSHSLFSNWVQNGSPAGTQTPLYVTMLSDNSVTAVFTPAYAVTLVVQGTGTTTPPPGPYKFPAGTLETFDVTESAGFAFSHWDFNGTNLGTQHPLSTTFTSGGILTAVFVQGYHLTTEMQGQGTISPPPGTYGYAANTSVLITVTPDTHHAVVQALVDGAPTSVNNGTISVTMNQDHTVSVQFTDWLLTVGVDGDGETNPSAPGIYPFANGAQPSIAAIAHSHSLFSNWIRDGLSAGSQTPLSFTITANTSVTAVFAPAQVLTISSEGQGVISPLAGTYKYLANTTTLISMTPKTNHKIVREIVDGVTTELNSTDPILNQPLLMNADHVVQVVFTDYLLTAAVDGTGGLTNNGAALAPGIYPYLKDTILSLDVTEQPGWVFNHWEQDSNNVGAQRPLQVTMEADTSVTAAFIPGYYLTLQEEGQGTIAPPPGTHPYAANTQALITATPNASHKIEYVVVDGGTPQQINSYTPVQYPVLMDAAHTVDVVFSDYLVTLGVQGDGETIPGVGTYAYLSGELTSFNVTAHPGATFDHWEQDGNNIGNQLPLQVPVTANTAITAVFIPLYNLTVSLQGHGQVNPAPGSYPYPANSTATLTLTPDPSHSVVKAIIDGVSQTINLPYQTTLAITMDKAHTVQIIFTDYLVTVAVNGDGQTVPAVGIHGYVAGQQTTFYASANTGSIFDHWEQVGVNKGTNPLLPVIVNGNTSVTAFFVPGYNLTVQYTGHGTVSPGAGVHGYSPNTPVTVTATPDANHQVFATSVDGVSNIVQSSSPVSIPLTMDSTHTVQITFTDYILTIASQGDGETDPPTGSYPFPAQAQQFVSATAHSDAVFSYWQENGNNVGAQNPLALTMSSDITLTAVFATAHTLTMTSHGQGVVSPSVGVHSYPTTSTVPITATPNPNHRVVRTTLDGSEITLTDPFTVSMTDNHTMDVVFTDYLLTVAVQGDGETTPAAGIYAYSQGDQVTLNVVEHPGAVFSHWEKNGTNIGDQRPLSVTMNADTAITAVFITGFDLTLTSEGQGTISPLPGIHGYSPNTEALVTAIPNNHHRIASVTLDQVPIQIPPTDVIAVPMGANHALDVVFTDYLVTVGVDGVGGTNPPPGIYAYSSGDMATIDAVEQPGYVFSYWSQDGTNIGSQRPLVVPVTSNTTITAVFVPGYVLTMIADGQGTVSPPPGAHGYPTNTVVPVTATPALHHEILRAIVDGVSQDIDSTDPVTVPFTMDGNHTIEVVFTDWLLTVATRGIGGTNPAAGIYPYSNGDQATLDVVEQFGYVFDHWDQDGTNIGSQRPLTVTLSSDTTITAVFVPGFRLTVTSSGHGTVLPGVGSFVYSPNTVVPFTLTPDPNHKVVRAIVDGIENDINSSGPVSGTLTMDTTHTVDVTFTDYLVTVAPPQGDGQTNPPAGIYAFLANDQTTIDATPNSGSVFDHWNQDGNNIGDQRPLPLTVTSDTTVTAVFLQGGYTLTTIAHGQGAISPAPGVHGYPTGASVPVIATPAPSHKIVRAIIDGTTYEVDSSDPISNTFIMNGNHTVEVFFTDYLVTVAARGPGTTNPPAGTYPFLAGATTSIDVVNAPGAIFNYWDQDGIDVGTQRPLSLTVNANTTITAVFVASYTLTTASQGQGTISPAPGSYQLPYNIDVPITLTPKPNHRIVRTILDGTATEIDSSTPVAYSLSMDGNHTLTAVFTDFLLTLGVQGDGETVPAAGAYGYSSGAQVSVDVVEHPGSIFTNWLQDGVDIGGQRPLQITMTADTSLTAVFKVSHTLTVGLQGQGTLSLASGPHVYQTGTQVTVTATANPQHLLANWSLDGTLIPPSDTLTVDMSQDHTLEAIFTQFLVTIAVTGDGTTVPGVGIHPVVAQAAITIEEHEAADSVFADWTQDGQQVGTGTSLTVTPTADTTITASFVPSKTLTLTQEGFGITVPTPGTYKYADNTPTAKASLAAVADPAHPGHVFKYWLVDGQQQTADPLTITMDANRAVKAVFTSYLVTLSHSGQGTLNPPDGVIPLTVEDNSLSIAATPDTGWDFDHWVLDNTNTVKTNPLSLSVTKDTSIEAFFVQQTKTLTVSTAGKGHLNLAAGPYPYTIGTNAVLTATPDPNHQLAAWVVNGSQIPASGNSLTVTMDADKSVEAIFTSYLITLQVQGPGTTTPPAGILAVAAGGSQGISATPASNAKFDHWTVAGASAGSTPTLTVTPTTDVTVVAVFKALYTLTLAASPPNAGSAQAATPGPYADGDSVQVSATANQGYRFDHWAGAVTGTNASASVTMDSDKSATAVFVPMYTLTVQITPTAGGTVVAVPQQAQYDAGTPVTLSATPNTGYQFIGWSGEASGTGDAQVTMNGNKTVIANFQLLTFTLTATVSPEGKGCSVTPNPAKSAYDYGSSVTLQAQAGPGYQFDHWEGDLTTRTNPETLTMTGNKAVTAVFILASHTLTTTVEPLDVGTVTADPPTGPYAFGTVVTLDATTAADSGYRFQQWTGDLQGVPDATVPEIKVTLDADKSLAAVFEQVFTLTANVNPVGAGAVSPNPAGPVYVKGAAVELTATPNPGYVFTGWTGDSNDTAAVTHVTMDANKTVTANFIQTFTLTASATPTGDGAVSADPPGPVYNQGASVQLTATPSAGFLFVRWEGDATGTASPVTVVMDSDKSVQAVFAPITFPLTLNVSPSSAGTATASPSEAAYVSGAVVQLEAMPAVGFTFSNWEGDATGTARVTTVTMDAAKTVTAVFVRQVCALNITTTPASSGSVSTNPAQGPFYYGDQVTLTPVPAQGYAFVRWEGDLTGSASPAPVVLNSDKNIVAVFSAQTYSLAVMASPSAGGSVGISPQKTQYLYGDQVTLTPAPAIGYKFDHWEGDVTGSAAPAQITMTGDKTVTAVFVQQTYTLTTAVLPADSGTVGTDSAGPYTYGTVVNLTPTPASGFAFDHWEGAVTGTNPSASVTMDADTSVTAVFVATTCPLTEFTRVFPADGSTIYLGPGTDTSELILFAATDCVDDTASVKFALGDLQATVTDPDSQQVYSVSAGTFAELGYGQHTLTVTATSKFHAGAVIEKVVTFTIAAANGTLDADGNGLPDNVYNALKPGDAWYSLVTDPVTGEQKVAVVVRWDTSGKAVDSANARVISLQDPSNPAAFITVTIPLDLFLSGESAVLVVQAAPDVATLYGAAGAAMFGVGPGTLVGGGRYASISILSSFNGGTTYAEVTAARLAARPLHVQMGGLDIAQSAASLFGHPSHAQDNASTGLELVAAAGPWSTSGITGLVRGDSSIDADLTRLGTFAPFDTAIGAAEIQVDPNTYAYNFVALGDTKDNVFKVTNLAAAGGEQLTGEATVGEPFTIIGDATYDLAPGESKEITVRFTPTAERDFEGYIIFTGGGGATVKVTGRAYNNQGVSCPALNLGSSSTGGMGAGRGDLLLLALTMMVLLAVGKGVGKRARNQ